MLDKARRKSLKKLSIVASIPLFAAFGFNTRATPKLSNSSVSLSNNWAVGGTKLLTDDFPDVSIFESKNACAIELTQPRILGPCYFSVDSSNDISAGLTGLPMMLCLRLVDSKCQPLVNHEIEVWHCDNRGVYSADTSNSNESNRFRTWQCAGNDKAAKRSTWYRGGQITDAEGRVNFKSCFPGWYAGRTIHIHVRVKSKEQVSLTTQLCFDDVLANEICSTHIEYKDRGLQDTPLTDDWFFRRNTDSALMSYKKNKNGTLLAYKTLQVK